MTWVIPFSRDALNNSMNFHAVIFVYTRAPNIQWNTSLWESHMKLLFQVSYHWNGSQVFTTTVTLQVLITFAWSDNQASSLAAAPAHSPSLGSQRACHSPPSISAQLLVPQSTHLSMAGQAPLSHLTFCGLLQHLFFALTFLTIYLNTLNSCVSSFCAFAYAVFIPLHLPPANLLILQRPLIFEVLFNHPRKILIFLSSPLMKVIYLHHK